MIRGQMLSINHFHFRLDYILLASYFRNCYLTNAEHAFSCLPHTVSGPSFSVLIQLGQLCIFVVTSVLLSVLFDIFKYS